MNLVQITPGAGSMYCGNCLRDNALVAALHRLGHQATLVPVYLPLTLDEPDQSSGVPIFYGGISVFLDHHWPWFRKAPAWIRTLLAAKPLLALAAGRAAKTRPEDVGGLTESMLLGTEGRQARDLEQLVDWLAQHAEPDLVCLSNALLIGMARRIRSALHVPVACMLQGEDAFLDALGEPHRTRCWELLASRVAEADVLMAPSRYFGDLMTRRLGLSHNQVHVVPNGISVAGYDAPSVPGPSAEAWFHKPAVGFLARMCPEKGLDTLVEAWMAVRQKRTAPKARLRIAGSCGPADQVFVKALQRKINQAGLDGEVEFFPNLGRQEKVKFLQSLTVFSVPARSGEAFGLYVLEALAAGVPVVQPRTAAFPELIEETGGGVLFPPEDPAALAGILEELLSDPDRARSLGEAGRRAVIKNYSAEAMARRTIEVFESARIAASTPSSPATGTQTL